VVEKGETVFDHWVRWLGKIGASGIDWSSSQQQKLEFLGLHLADAFGSCYVETQVVKINVAVGEVIYCRSSVQQQLRNTTTKSKSCK